jgi:hypothetical protein
LKTSMPKMAIRPIIGATRIAGEASVRVLSPGKSARLFR